MTGRAALEASRRLRQPAHPQRRVHLEPHSRAGGQGAGLCTALRGQRRADDAGSAWVEAQPDGRFARGAVLAEQRYGTRRDAGAHAGLRSRGPHGPVFIGQAPARGGRSHPLRQPSVLFAGVSLRRHIRAGADAPTLCRHQLPFRSAGLERASRAGHSAPRGHGDVPREGS